MATAEEASAPVGPRYAPDDPSLPQPWKVLIDGSTVYYWNPETNITQYEKPSALPPPLAPVPPVPSTPTLAPIPGARTMQPNGVPSHHAHQMPPVAQQHSQAQQPGQLTPQQMIHQSTQQMYPQHQMPPQGNQIPQQARQQTQMYQSAQMGQSPGYQFSHQQMQHMPYHQNMGQQSSLQQTPQTQVQQYSHQRELNAVFSHREDADLQQGKQQGLSPSQISSIQNPPTGTNSIQFGGLSINMQHPSGMDFGQHGPRFHNQVGPMRGHPIGLKMGYDENQPGSEYHFNGNKDGPAMVLQQPKLAAIPMARNQQEMRMSALPHQNASPGGPNPVPGPALNGIYSNSTGVAPFPNTAMMRPPSMVMGSPDAVEVYNQKHEITVTGDNVPAPFMQFEDTGFPPEILREIHSAGFSSPTPIQAQTWPIALQSKDIVAIAKTGSGKTLGYLIPAFMLLRRCRNNPQNGPTVVIIAPTRELATQIQDEVVKFGRSSRVSCTCLYGGAPKGPQLKELERGADMVVATPGRLNDILEMKKVDFGQVSLLVLDEADRMLDMGFEPQIRKIVNEIPPNRQTLMYTATWPKEVRKIAGDLLVNPVQVNIGRVDELAANKSITQLVELVPQMGKQKRLEEILRSQERGSKIIVFCSTKRQCDQLTRTIGRNFGAAAIHGDKSQGERDWVLSQFRNGKSPILVATDVAARGLDIKDIRVVVNYDFPTGVEDYVHRIGRTGRAGATGLAYTFFSDQDWKYAADLIKVLEGANQAVPKEVREMAVRGGPNFGRDRGGGGRWDSGGRGGMRDSNFGGRGGMRDGNFGGRSMRDMSFGGRGGMREENFSGRGGMRDGNFGGRGGSRGGGFGGPADRNRNERGPLDRFADGRGFGRGRGRGQFDSRKDVAERSRGRSYSSSPDRVRTWGRSRSRSRSYSTSRSRSRSPRRSRSRSPNRYVRRRESKFDQREVPLLGAKVPPESGMFPVPVDPQNNETSGAGPEDQLPFVKSIATEP